MFLKVYAIIMFVITTALLISALYAPIEWALDKFVLIGGLIFMGYFSTFMAIILHIQEKNK